MTLASWRVPQAAVEYGVGLGAVAARIADLAETVAASARDAWHVVVADPVLLAGLAVVGVLAVLLLRTPTR